MSGYVLKMYVGEAEKYEEMHFQFFTEAYEIAKEYMQNDLHLTHVEITHSKNGRLAEGLRREVVSYTK